MQLQVSQLFAALQEKLLPVYIISGDDIFLVQEAVDLICNAAQQKKFILDKIYYLDNEFGLEDLHSALFNFSLFDNKKIIRLDIGSTKISPKLADILITYVKKQDENKILLINSARVENVTKKNLWFKTISETGIWVPIWPLKENNFRDWLVAKCRSLNLSITPDVLSILLMRLEGNLSLANQSLINLKAYLGEKKLNVALLNAWLSDDSKYNVFDLLDSMLAANTKRSLHILARLKAHKDSLAMILGAFCFELNKLTLCSPIYNGSNIVALSLQYKIWPQKRAAFQATLERLDLSSLSQLQQLAAIVDQGIKGWNKCDPWSVMFEIIMLFTSNATPVGIELLNNNMDKDYALGMG